MSNNLFKCQQCDKEYDIPKSLPCGNSVCSACLLQTCSNNEKLFNCKFCNSDHEVPVNGFPTNIILFQLMNNESSAEKTVDLKESKFKKEINEIDLNLKSLKENTTNLIKSKFHEIRDEIIARSELLAKSLYDYTETALNDIDVYESHILNKRKISDNFEQKLNEIKNEVDRKSSDSICDNIKCLNDLIKLEIEKVPKLNIFDEEKFQYELSNVELDRTLVCKLKLFDEIKFEKMANKINNFNKIINYKPNDTQTIYDYKNFASSLDNEMIVVGLNLKIKSTAKPTPSNSTGFCYKLKIIIFDNAGQIINELPLANVINEKFKQLEHFLAYRDFIYCIYIDSNMQYCLKIFNSKFETVKDMKFNSIIKSIDISDDSIIYILYNILSVDLFDLNFEKLASFGQLIDESEPFYLESSKEIIIQNDKIYICLNNEKSIKILERSSGLLLKTIDIDLENCILQVNSLSKILAVNRINKKLLLYDENGKLICENELINIQNISSFFITNENLLVVNDFPNRILYVF
jgi:hypothetical protein